MSDGKANKALWEAVDCLHDASSWLGLGNIDQAYAAIEDAEHRLSNARAALDAMPPSSNGEPK